MSTPCETYDCPNEALSEHKERSLCSYCSFFGGYNLDVNKDRLHLDHIKYQTKKIKLLEEELDAEKRNLAQIIEGLNYLIDY